MNRVCLFVCISVCCVCMRVCLYDTLLLFFCMTTFLYGYIQYLSIGVLYWCLQCLQLNNKYFNDGFN